MKKPSQGQVLNAIAILMNNADWDAVSGVVLQKVIDNPRDAGSQFTAFLKNGGRVIVGEPKIIPIDRTSAFDPVAIIGDDWSIMEEDERSLALTKVDLTEVSFETTLKDETLVYGKERLRRLVVSGDIRLDAKVFQTLYENQHLIPKAWKKPTNGNTTYIFFDGTILRDPSGCPCTLYLYWDAAWRWDYSLLDDPRYDDDPSAVLEN